MNLNNEQKAAVASWIQEGTNLSDVQKRIHSEFGILLTYMDVRFLVDDLELELSDKPPAHFAQQKKADASFKLSPGKGDAPTSQGPAAPADAELVDDGPAGGGAVSVTLDKIARPGALVSGSVTFSDGVGAQWHLDQMGRLALNASQPGYKPSEKDVMEFQVELQRLVEQRGGF